LIALDGGDMGLEPFKEIAEKASILLRNDKNSHAIVEIGVDQSKDVISIFESLTSLRCVDVCNDFSGIPRSLVFLKTA